MTIKDLELTMLDGSKVSFADFSDRVVLVVNVASRCGLAPQYAALEAIHKKYADRGFTVLGMPSNQFLQELGKSEKIAEYCSTTWGISFPMTEKVKVNGKNAHDLYKALTKTKDSFGLAGRITWNFEKFLVLPNGQIHRFRPPVKPDSPQIIELIEANLPR